VAMMMVPLEAGRVRWRPNGSPGGGVNPESQMVFALAVAPSEDLDRRPRTWAINGFGEWLALGHGDGEGRLA